MGKSERARVVLLIADSREHGESVKIGKRERIALLPAIMAPPVRVAETRVSEVTGYD